MTILQSTSGIVGEIPMLGQPELPKVVFEGNWWDNQSMENHDAKRHPGPWQVMQLDSEFAGLLLAVGFLVMGLVSMPLATGFVLGAITLGVVVALLLRFTPRKFSRVIVGTVVVLAAFVLLWAGSKPRRPHTVSSKAVYVLPNNVPFRLHKAGYWFECWYDKNENVDRCKLTDEKGNGAFEDVFLPSVGQTPLPQSELVFKRFTGDTWTQSRDKRINVPVVYLDNGQTLLSRSLFAEAKQQVAKSADHTR